MNEKYLPIGTVCVVNNKEVMIIGYSIFDLYNGLKKKDYFGCAYPEGLLLPNQLIYFDHSDISSILFLGFANQKYMNLNDLLKNSNGIVKNESPVQDTSKYVFDENGVLISTGEAPAAQSEAVAPETQGTSQYVFDENGVLVSTGEAQAAQSVAVAPETQEAN